MTIKEISEPINKHLEEFNKYFKSLMNTDVALLNLVIQYITKKKGKQVRPVLVFLSAELCGGVNKRTHIGATMVELLHTATLTHDDVVDEAAERRGMASINATWNNKIAVLIGDFLLAKGLLASIDNNEFDFLRANSQAVRRMSEGELLQIQKSKDVDIDEETYFKIISNKTASLMASCCEIGAISATDDRKIQEKMKLFGEMIGTAFQIRDDIFDYQSKNILLGKPVGNDLKEKKMTLPLIYSINQVPKKVAKRYTGFLKNNNLKKKDIKEIISFVTEQGGIIYAENVSKEYSDKAIDLLSDFDDCPAKSSLIEFCKFVIDRKI
ncbi:polyprenyl synthetase family protein [Bacteroidota bacterium]